MGEPKAAAAAVSSFDDPSLPLASCTLLAQGAEAVRSFPSVAVTILLQQKCMQAHGSTVPCLPFRQRYIFS